MRARAQRMPLLRAVSCRKTCTQKVQCCAARAVTAAGWRLHMGSATIPLDRGGDLIKQGR